MGEGCVPQLILERCAPLILLFERDPFLLGRFALKLLDKKRIKVKKGELLALNEKNMLAKVLGAWQP